MRSKGKILKVSGPLVVADGMKDANVYDVVEVSKDKLIGEIIEMRGDRASIQVYEETTGIGPGDEVVSIGSPLSVELGPGLLEQMFDGIQRPLEALKNSNGDFLVRGGTFEHLDREKKWEFKPQAKVGDILGAGDILGTVEETSVITHKIMVPYGVKGKVKEIKSGIFTVADTIAILETENGDKELNMIQRWPVRRGRPYKEKIDPRAPLITGQRVIDTFFPITKHHLHDDDAVFLDEADRDRSAILESRESELGIGDVRYRGGDQHLLTEGLTRELHVELLLLEVKG